MSVVWLLDSFFGIFLEHLQHSIFSPEIERKIFSILFTYFFKYTLHQGRTQDFKLVGNGV